MATVVEIPVNQCITFLRYLFIDLPEEEEEEEAGISIIGPITAIVSSAKTFDGQGIWTTARLFTISGRIFRSPMLHHLRMGVSRINEFLYRQATTPRGFPLD